MPFFLLQSVPQDKQWMIYAAAGAGVIYLLMRMQAKKRGKDPLSDAPVRFPLSQQKSLEREMQNLLVEMSTMARQITAQLDTRSAKLEVLIQEADQKIAELRALTGDDGRSLPTISVARTPSTAAQQDDPRHAAVYQLADQGLNCQQIAQELGRHSGEIELILALRGKKD